MQNTLQKLYQTQIDKSYIEIEEKDQHFAQQPSLMLYMVQKYLLTPDINYVCMMI